MAVIRAAHAYVVMLLLWRPQPHHLYAFAFVVVKTRLKNKNILIECIAFDHQHLQTIRTASLGSSSYCIYRSVDLYQVWLGDHQYTSTHACSCILDSFLWHLDSLDCVELLALHH